VLNVWNLVTKNVLECGLATGWRLALGGLPGPWPLSCARGCACGADGLGWPACAWKEVGYAQRCLLELGHKLELAKRVTRHERERESTLLWLWAQWIAEHPTRGHTDAVRDGDTRHVTPRADRR
jgi:hypothetical protein